MSRLGLCAIVLSAAAWAASSGPVAGVAGVPGENNCTACHGGAVNAGGGRLTVSLVEGATWTPGQQVRLRITLADPTARRWGFQITARSSWSPTTNAGTFALADSATTRRVTGDGGTEYIEHNAAGSRAGTADSSSWEVLWTPPSSASFGQVTFYAAGNAANNDGANDAGDKIYLTTLTANPAGEIPGATYALSQLAYGGGWYTAVYLTNANSAAATATLSYYGAGGAPLAITGVGTSTTLNLGPGATGLVEAADLGPLTQGWVEARLPEGVTGYGVFRQTVAGRPQEAVVPLANAISTSGTFIFDETNYVTAAAFVNAGSREVSVTVTARGADGAVIGSAGVTMAARARSAVVLTSLAGLEAMRGKRGTVELSSPAPVTVLGLRFNGEAFTSIPAVQK